MKSPAHITNIVECKREQNESMQKSGTQAEKIQLFYVNKNYK